jgi:hypothetical protein
VVEVGYSDIERQLTEVLDLDMVVVATKACGIGYGFIEGCGSKEDDTSGS